MNGYRDGLRSILNSEYNQSNREDKLSEPESKPEPKTLRWWLIVVEEITPSYLNFVFDYLRVQGIEANQVELNVLRQELWGKIPKWIMTAEEFEQLDQARTRTANPSDAEIELRYKSDEILRPPPVKNLAYRIYKQNYDREIVSLRAIVQHLAAIHVKIAERGVVPTGTVEGTPPPAIQ